jgi:hypothetical protein
LPEIVGGAVGPVSFWGRSCEPEYATVARKTITRTSQTMASRRRSLASLQSAGPDATEQKAASS